MGMGRGTQNASSGMQGKGGAARPNPVQRPVQQPVAGMGGKGVGQPPAQQPNLNNALSGLAGAPVQTYPFPQSPAQQPTAGMGGKGVGQQPVLSQPQLDIINSGGTVGMGGKGVGTRQLDPLMQPYVNNLVSGMQQAEPGVLDPSRYTNYDQQAPAAGMGGKGVGGQLPPQAGTLNETLMGLYQPPVQVQPAPAAGMGGKGVGQTRNPELEALAAYKAIAPEQRGELVQPAPVQQAPMAYIGEALRGLAPMPPAVSPAPTTTQIAQPSPQQEAQRAIQRFGSVRRGRLGRR
jgi:hypothetical protein